MAAASSTNVTNPTSTMSICMISLEEHQFPDGTSNIELLIENTLPTTLELILDKNTQLLFDQDPTNLRLYITRNLNQSAVLSLLSCLRNMGWNITASNGYYSNNIIRKFYFEKLFDLTKIVLVEPLKSKRNSRLAFHFDTTPTTSEPNNSKAATNLAEFSRAIDKVVAQEAHHNSEEPTRPSSIKQRRSSIAEGKPSLVFKQLAERRKVSTNSSHPLDSKFANESSSSLSPLTENDSNPSPSPPPPTTPTALTSERSVNRASSSPPPLRSTTTVPFSNNKSGELQSLKKGNVGGLANMFANQLLFQPGGAPPPIKKKIDTEIPLGDQQLSTPTASRPVTERKRRPTAERRSIHITSMRMPLVASTSFDENDTNRLSEVKEGDDHENDIAPVKSGSHPAGRKLTNTNPLLFSKSTEDNNSSQSQGETSIQQSAVTSNKVPFSEPVVSHSDRPHSPKSQSDKTETKTSTSAPSPPSPPRPPTSSASATSTVAASASTSATTQKPSPPPIPPPNPPPNPPSDTKGPSTEQKSPPTIPLKTPPPPPILEPKQTHMPPQPPPAPPTSNNPPSHPTVEPKPTVAPPQPPIPPNKPPPQPPIGEPPSVSGIKAPPPPSTPPPPPMPEHKPPPIPQPRSETNISVPTPPPPHAAVKPTEEQEITFSFEDDRFSDVQRGSVMELDRLANESARVKNAAYFKQMKEEEERKKQEKLDGLSPEERERLSIEEDAAKAHDQNKLNHFAKLGKSFAVSTSSKLLNGGRGRGGVGSPGGRGSPMAKKALP